MKICNACKIEKPLTEFHKRKHRTMIGTSPRCKPCDKAKTYAWRAKNPERTRELVAQHYDRTRDEKREIRASQRRASKRRRRENDPNYLINERIGDQMRALLKYCKRGASWQGKTGYSIAELRVHIERQFLPGMSWDNRREWEIDHILPVSRFDIKEIGDAEFRAAWSLSNLRPIWKSDNRKKWAHRTLLC